MLANLPARPARFGALRRCLRGAAPTIVAAILLAITTQGASSQEATSTSVTASPNPSIFGQTVTLTAIVTSGTGTPTGTVHFTGPNLNETVSLSNGVATTSSANMTSGTVQAEYEGSATHQRSSGNVSVTVNVSPTTLVLTASPNPSRPGDPVTLTATVTSDAPEAGTPTGTVGFTLPGGFFESATLVGGVARITLSSLQSGMVTAEYFGDTRHGPGEGSVEVEIDPEATFPTTTTVTVTPDPSVAGQLVEVRAFIDVPGEPEADGTITLSGPGFSQTVELIGAGYGIILTQAVASGTVTASYNGTDEFEPSVGTVDMTVNPGPTVATVVATPNPSNAGQAVVLTATVTGLPGTGTPTGTVTFSEPGGGNQTAPLVGGQATVSTTSLVTGTVTATYNGSATHGTSSGTVAVTVSSAATTTTVTVDPDPSVSGQVVTLTATVASVSGSGSPTGSVTFSAPGGFSQAATLEGGVATVTTMAVASGTVAAVYAGDATFQGSQGATTMMVGPAPTETTVIAAPNPSTAGQVLTLTATVAAQPPGSGTPAGTVTFSGPSGLNQTASLDSSGTASITVTATVSGTVTASYAGSATFAASQGTVELDVDKIVTATTVTAVPNPSDGGQSVVVTATVVTVPGGQGTPAGNVLFTGPGGLAQLATLDGSGVATITSSSLPSGTVRASYQGNPVFAASQGTVAVTVNRIPTTTTVSASPNPSAVGQSVTLTATVVADPPGGTPVGTVRFVGPRGFNQAATLDASGTATVTLAAAASGTVAAIYEGTATFAGSQGTIDLIVGQAPTTTAVTADPASSVAGQTITLTATVAASPPGGVTPTGNVTFTGPGGLSVNATLNASGLAVVTTTAMISGTITASYAGNATFTGSEGTTAITVGPSQTSTNVTAAPNPSDFGQTVTLTATVAAVPPGTGAPTGSMTFTGPRGLNQTVPLSGGEATITTTRLASGTVTATYGGSPTHAASSGTVDIIVNPPTGTVTTVTATPDPSFVGQSVTLTATVTVLPPGTGMPTGRITFTGPGGLNQTVAVGAGASASIATTTLRTGTVTAIYAGSGAHAGSTGTVAVTVNQAETTTAVTVSPDPSNPGDTVTLTATVTAVVPATGTPTGSVTFSGPAGLNRTAALASGVATITVTAAASGTVTAAYGSDATFGGSEGTAAMTVNQIGTRTTVAASPNPSNFGQEVTLTARVSPLTRTRTPAGMVTFTGPGGLRERAALNGSGIASIRSSTLESGTVTAAYAGDTTFTGSDGSVEVEVRALGSVTLRQVVEGSDAVFTYSSPTPALNLSVSTSNGRGETDAVALASGRYRVIADDMRGQGYALTALACSDNDSIGDAATRTAIINLAPGEEVVCTFTSVNSREKTTELIEDFFETRAGLILSNQPGIQRRIDRLKGNVSSSGNPVTALLGYLPSLAEGAPLAVAASLASIERLSGDTGQYPFDIWFAGTYAKFDSDGPTGDFGLVTLGADYLVSPDLLVGGFIQVDRLSQSSSADDTSISGTGWLVGPYATARLTENLFLDVLAGIGTSSNTVSPFGTYEDDFDATRWLVSASLQGEWTYDAWTFSPRVRLSYFEESSKDYTDSLGVDIPEVTVGLGQVAIGPGVSYRHATDSDIIIDTGLRFEGVADFLNEEDESGFDNLHGRVEGTLDFTFPGGARLGLAIAQDGIGSGGLRATGGRIRLSIPMD